MEGVTSRQTQILKALIDEYIETAEPVGSESLDKKYNFGVSPATIRNEMATLTHIGYLRQPHTSAGRVPTPKAMKFYINQLMEERQMSLTEEVKTKEEVWDARNDLDDLMHQATHSLARHTGALAVAASDSGGVWHSGYANVFLHPEFGSLEVSANIFTFLEEVKKIQDIFFSRMTGQNPVEVLFGEELGFPNLDYIGVVGTRFRMGDRECALGIVGPERLRYSRIIPVMKYFKNLMDELAVG